MNCPSYLLSTNLASTISAILSEGKLQPEKHEPFQQFGLLTKTLRSKREIIFVESSYAFFLFLCLFLHRLLSFLLLSRKPVSFFYYTRSSAVDRSSQHEYSTETNAIESWARVHTGVKSGLPIDAEQPLAGEPSCVPWLAKSPLYEPDDSPTRRVTRNFHERSIHPFLPYLPFPFSRRTLVAYLPLFVAFSSVSNTPRLTFFRRLPTRLRKVVRKYRNRGWDHARDNIFCVFMRIFIAFNRGNEFR